VQSHRQVQVTKEEEEALKQEIAVKFMVQLRQEFQRALCSCLHKNKLFIVRVSDSAQLGRLPLRQHASKLLILTEEFAVDLENCLCSEK
jgi:hypothetical protein